MSRFGLVAACAAVIVLVAGAPGLAEPAPVTYADPVGDAGTAADVTSLRLSYAAGGFFLIDTTFATPFTNLTRFSIYFDTDRNIRTGSDGGAEYRVRILGDDVFWARWNNGWVDKDGSITRSLSPDKTLLGLSIDKGDIGGANAFDFYVISYQTATDDEDDVPLYPCELHYPSPARLSLESCDATAGQALAGGTWGVGMAALRSDTGESVSAGGKVTCAATGSRMPLVTTTRRFVKATDGRFAGTSYAVCEFRVPKTLRHKTLHAKVTVTYRGSTIAQTFTTTAR